MYLILGVGLVFLVIMYSWYAGIIGKKNGANEALSGIDVQLKQRSDVIPNILTIAKKFMEHEKTLLTEITELRTRADQPYNKNDQAAVQTHLQTADALSSKMGQLRIAVENYPTLKSDATMVQAMRTYNEIEAQIAAARRFYNSSVTALNNSIQIFPGNIIASMVNVSEMPFYKADEAAHAPVDAAKFL